MTTYDLHIKGGTIVDGTRVPRYRGDVWIKDGKVAQIGGRRPGAADKTIDADGLIVAPGFVDLHTHYDAQIRWDPWCTISGWHGVTSLVLGNCGFGFAPVKPDARERSMLTMVRTEAIPYDSMVRACCQVGLGDHPRVPRQPRPGRQGRELHPVHAHRLADDLRHGPRGGQDPPGHRRGAQGDAAPAARGHGRRPLRLLHPAPRARTRVQADFDGTPMVTDTMCDEDILALAEVLAERDEGFIQITQASGDIRVRPGLPREAGRRGPAPDPAQRRRPRPQGPRGAPPPAALGRQVPQPGPAHLRPVRHGPGRLRLHARALEPLRRQPRLAGRHHRHQGREAGQDARPRAARGPGPRGRGGRPAACRSSRPASAATRPGSSSRACTTSTTCAATRA